MASQGQERHQQGSCLVLGCLPWFSMLLVACGTPPIHEFTPDSGLEDIAIHGRIVDFESCASWNRCMPIEGLRARLHWLPTYVSEPSEQPGRFDLPAPPAHEDDIIVDPGTRTNYARTLNPGAAPAVLSDIFGVELYAIPLGVNSDGSQTIIAALAEAGIDLVGDGTRVGEGGYLGQVLRQDEEGLHAVMEARVEVMLPPEWPAGVSAPRVRFINAVPRYTSGDILFAESRNSTGSFGLFVIPTQQQSATIKVKVHTLNRLGEIDTIFTEINAPVEPGIVTIGLHTP